MFRPTVRQRNPSGQRTLSAIPSTSGRSSGRTLQLRNAVTNFLRFVRPDGFHASLKDLRLTRCGRSHNPATSILGLSTVTVSRVSGTSVLLKPCVCPFVLCPPSYTL